MHLHEKSFLKFSFEGVGNAHFKVYCIWNQVLPFVGESFKPSCISLGGEKAKGLFHSVMLSWSGERQAIKSHYCK